MLTPVLLFPQPLMTPLFMLLQSLKKFFLGLVIDVDKLTNKDSK
jgi:hypothetical protein